MPDLLLELFSEEIPARMQRRAADDLKKLVTDALVARGLVYESASAFSTPRRLTLVVGGLPVKGQDIREEKKGPRVGAPDQAVQGFLKSAGLTSLDQATVISDPKKGDFYVAFLEKPGQATAEAIAEIVPAVIRSFPWPKSMRWGAASTSSSSLRWVRPLQSILCTFGPETEEPEVIRFDVDGIVSGDITYGHRFHAPQPIKVRRFEDYVAKLEAAKVILDPERRKQIILNEARTLAFAQGLELIEDEALADEVSGLVEWPVPLMGRFDPAFLAIPGEVIRATIRANQKCFVLRAPSLLPSREKVPSGSEADEGGPDPSPGSAGAEPPSPARGEGVLSNRFILTANLVASDGGGAIIAGNERVVKARLSDALHFWNTDQRDVPDLAALKDSADRLGLDLTRPLDQRMARLDHLKVVFHEKLGTQGERVQRIVALARELAKATGADPELCARAALLAKADLQSEVVGEFPEVQGLMGRRYAELQGEDASVCAAIEEHYKPLGPSDRVPSDPVSVTVALADKLDTLVGFWAIDEKPTGSKDPYALRRAALGVIRLVVENGVRLQLLNHLPSLFSRWRGIVPLQQPIRGSDFGAPDTVGAWQSLKDFFHDRLKGMLKDQGARHDLVDAVLAGAGSSLLPLREKVPSGSEADEGAVPSPGASRHPLPQGERGSSDDLLMVVRRVEALTAFLASEDGANLLAGYRRAANILKAEEKKDGRAFDGAVEAARLAAPEEQALATVLATTVPAVADAVAREDFAAAMTALAALRRPVDAFFETVTVNADDPALRANRLNLLASLRAATLTVADFARIGG